MKPRIAVLLLLVCAVAARVAAQPVDTAFTYQGRLKDAGAPANGPYDFRFLLYDAAVGGSQVGPIVTKDDVAVADGLFTVSLDFGPAAFTGAKRWLDVSVRAGSSTGPYTPLTERQELQAAPHSAFSLRSPWTGIAGKPAGFADDTDNDAIGSLACSGGQVAKWNGSAWACANDIDTNSGGTVTSVATGGGLTGGPISTTGTISVATGGIATAMLADGAVTSPKIANGAVGLAQINTAEVQARVAATCPPNNYLRGINANGTVICEPILAAANVITTVDDPANNVGQYTSIKVGADGLPVISYYDVTAGDLKVAHCGNATCTLGVSAFAVDASPNNVGQYTSLAIGSDGLPVISYQDLTFPTLKVAHCGDAVCTPGPAVMTTVGAGGTGSFSSIAIGTDGLPVVSYRDVPPAALSLVHCGTPTCQSGNVFRLIDDPPNSVGQHTSIAIGADGFPVISYFDITTSDLKVAHCVDVTCAQPASAFTVDPAGFAGQYTSIAIGTDGLPVISYWEATAGALKVVKCGNAACSGGNVITAVDDNANIVGLYTSIAIGTDGLPVISYYDQTAGTLKVAHCGNPACSAGNTIALVDDPADNVGSYSAIAIGTDGLPIISYYDQTAGTLKVAKCATRTCQ